MAESLPPWKRALPLTVALITVIVVIGTFIQQDLFRPSIRVGIGVATGLLVAHLVARGLAV